MKKIVKQGNRVPNRVTTKFHLNALEPLHVRAYWRYFAEWMFYSKLLFVSRLDERNLEGSP